MGVSLDNYFGQGMGLPSIRSVDTNFVDLFRIVSNVLDMSQDVTSPVLADEVSQVGAKSHICDSRLVIPPFLNWESFEQDKALSV